MTLCPNGQNPTIEWQYTGEEKQRIIKADSYSLTENRICPGVPHLFYYRTAIIDRTNCVLQGWSGQFTSQGWAGNTSPAFTNFRLYSGDVLIASAPTVAGWAANLEKPFWSHRTNVGNVCGENVPNHGTSRFFLYCDSAIGTNHLLLNSTARGILMSGFQPDPNADLSACQNQCVFTVTKNGQTVYTKTRSICPTVTHFCGEQCPPGSCECTCGTGICCYHPTTGAVVKSFTR